MSPRERWHTQGSTMIMASVRAGQWRNIIKKDTDNKRPVYTFYNFSFSCEAGVLLLSLKLENFYPSFYTHTHLTNGQEIDSSHNYYLFPFCSKCSSYMVMPYSPLGKIYQKGIGFISIWTGYSLST